MWVQSRTAPLQGGRQAATPSVVPQCWSPRAVGPLGGTDVPPWDRPSALSRRCVSTSRKPRRHFNVSTTDAPTARRRRISNSFQNYIGLPERTRQ